METLLIEKASTDCECGNSSPDYRNVSINNLLNPKLIQVRLEVLKKGVEKIIETTEPSFCLDVIHSYWTDTLKFYDCGVFSRTHSCCKGIWCETGNDEIELTWFDWGVDRIIPSSLDSGKYVFVNSNKTNSILPTGIWMDLQFHCFDEALSNEILKFCLDHGIQSAVDIGCGPGWYGNNLTKSGILYRGYDGTPVKVPCVWQKDLSAPFLPEYDAGIFDLTLSLEVGEHIPKEYEQIFIDNVCFFKSHFIMISWAVPEQGGHGHVNCRENEYIKIKMAEKKYLFDVAGTDEFRQKASQGWFKNSLMFFKKMTRKNNRQFRERKISTNVSMMTSIPHYFHGSFKMP